MSDDSKPAIRRSASSAGDISHCSSDTDKPSVKRCASSAADLLRVSTPDDDQSTEADDRTQKSVSADLADSDNITKFAARGSFKRRSIRRRSSRRLSRPEPEYGHDTEAYEKLRERVLQERAVTNAIDALQERWRMIMFMYDDLVDLNEERMNRNLKKLCVKRQFELVVIVAVFVLLCLPVSLIFALMTR